MEVVREGFSKEGPSKLEVSRCMCACSKGNSMCKGSEVRDSRTHSWNSKWFHGWPVEVKRENASVVVKDSSQTLKDLGSHTIEGMRSQLKSCKPHIKLMLLHSEGNHCQNEKAAY